ncbi:MAG: hypothetical protein NZZ41_03120 [Candidatus Dojkabacteria bacterium]|nr:hypothetical protein [Candidatus Dojkabacteria bacterium]
MRDKKEEMSMPMPCVSNETMEHIAIKFPKLFSEVKKIFVTKNNRIRSSFPNQKDNPVAYYIWRMCVFNVSTNYQHHSIPVCADLYITEKHYGLYSGNTPYEKKMSLLKELNEVVDIIVNSIPKEKWYGVMRWGKALGY